MNDWRAQAACRGMDANIFHPEKGCPHDGDFARKICQGCPVKTHCLLYALEECIPLGIWGGKSFKERLHWKRRMRAGDFTQQEWDALEEARLVTGFDPFRKQGRGAYAHMPVPEMDVNW